MAAHSSYGAANDSNANQFVLLIRADAKPMPDNGVMVSVMLPHEVIGGGQFNCAEF